MTAGWIWATVAAVVSLLLEVVPGLAKWWAGLDDTQRRLGWLIGCLAIPLVLVGAGCVGVDLGVVAPACDWQGVVEALKLGFAAYFAGQAMYALVGKKVQKLKAR